VFFFLKKANKPSSLLIFIRRIARSSFVSKIFNLNFLSPKIVERILNGTHPRELRLKDLINKVNPDLWQEQEESW